MSILTRIDAATLFRISLQYQYKRYGNYLGRSESRAAVDRPDQEDEISLMGMLQHIEIPTITYL
jgi:hypothetical protein